ncbi:hypothetical protein HYU11_01520 [Candidatus Woesearchaeota archaeon]|nr:hypothetical protein [Candidatus Woesearchaeota archaeon]
MKKNAVSLSFETITVAAIALTVLIVVILIFTGNIGKIVDSITGLNQCQGSCERDRIEGQICIKSGCPKETKWCCSDG